MGRMGKYGKNQGKIYFLTLIMILIFFAVIIGAGYGLYHILRPKYDAYVLAREQERIKQEKIEQKEQEQAKQTAIEGSTAWNGHTYKVFEDGMTWTEAKSYCENLGGHLVIIESQDEQVMLESLLKEKNFYWLGASVDLEKENAPWHWINGKTLEYTNWHGTQPDNFTGNENCLMMYNYPNPVDGSTIKGVWNDVQEDGTCNDEEFFGAENSGFICEWDS